MCLESYRIVFYFEDVNNKSKKIGIMHAHNANYCRKGFLMLQSFLPTYYVIKEPTW